MAAGLLALYAAAWPWSIAPLSIAVALVLAATAVDAIRSRRLAWSPGPVDAAGLAWFVAMLLSAWFALDREASLGRVAKGLFPLLVGIVAGRATDRRTGERALAALFVSSMLASLYGLVLWIARGAGYPSRARGLVGHYMTFAGQLLLIASAATGVALLGRTTRWRALAAACAALALVALAATFTRSAWLGYVVSAAVMLACTRPRAIPLLLAGVVVLFMVAPAPWRDRMTSAFDPAHPNNRERTFMWEAGARMFRDHPITGVGLSDLKPIYDRYKDPGARERAGHLHSVPVQVAATMGTVGLLALLALVIAMVRAATRGLRAQIARGGVAAGVRLGVLGGLAGFAVAGLFEWNLGDEELLHLLYGLAGLAWAARAWDVPEHRPR